jgi:Tfp pilus assembly protein PilN
VSQQINLYSPVFRKQTKVFSAAAMLQGVGLIVLVIAVFYFYMAAQSSLLELRAVESAQLLKSELERLKVYGVLESPAERARSVAERRKAAEDSLASQTAVLEMLQASFGRTDGYSELLRALARVSVEGVWLTRVQFSEAGGELSIAGRASRPDLVPVYLERLRGDRALRTQEFTQLELARPPAEAKPGAAPPTYVEFMFSSTVEAAKAK